MTCRDLDLLFLSVEIMNLRVVYRMIRAVALTVAVTHWSAALIGPRRFYAVLVITFVWTAIANRQLLASDHIDMVRPFRWSRDLLLTAIGGPILWAVLPRMRLANEDGWFWLPVTIPVALTVLGTIAALYWPLHPFVKRLRTKQGSQRSEFNAPLLCCCFFLISGSLVFAAGASASLLNLLARRVSSPQWRRRVRLSYADFVLSR